MPTWRITTRLGITRGITRIGVRSMAFGYLYARFKLGSRFNSRFTQNHPPPLPNNPPIPLCPYNPHHLHPLQ